jgi:hypothetical protein
MTWRSFHRSLLAAGVLPPSPSLGDLAFNATPAAKRPAKRERTGRCAICNALLSGQQTYYCAEKRCQAKRRYFATEAWKKRTGWKQKRKPARKKIPADGMKDCPRCHKHLPLDAFAKDRWTPTRRQAQCRKCFNKNYPKRNEARNAKTRKALAAPLE